jgi:hypothetical protein
MMVIRRSNAMNSLRDTAERLKALAELCAAAEARSLVAASCFALALPEDAEPPTTG